MALPRAGLMVVPTVTFVNGLPAEAFPSAEGAVTMDFEKITTFLSATPLFF